METGFPELEYLSFEQKLTIALLKSWARQSRTKQHTAAHRSRDLSHILDLNWKNRAINPQYGGFVNVVKDSQ